MNMGVGLFINLIGGSLVSWFAFKAARSGNITAAVVLGAIYIAITIYFN